MGGWIILAVIVLAGLWLMMTYNSLVSLKNQVDAAWRQIERTRETTH